MNKPAAAENLEDLEGADLGDGDGDGGGEEEDSSHALGEAYFYGGRAAWCEDHGVSVIDNPEGAIGVYLPGEGFVSLHDFFKRMPKPGAGRITRVK